MNSKLKYSIFAFLAIVALLAIFIYKPQRDIKTEIAFANLESKTLIDDFDKDSKGSLSKYANQTIIIKGEISEIGENLIVLDNVISCTIIEPETKYKPKDTIIIKGKLTGYENDILTEIKIQECSVITK